MTKAEAVEPTQEEIEQAKAEVERLEALRGKTWTTQYKTCGLQVTSGIPDAALDALVAKVAKKSNGRQRL